MVYILAGDGEVIMKPKEMDEMVIVQSVVFYERFIRAVFGSAGVKLFIPEAPFIAYQAQPCQSSHEQVNEFRSHFIMRLVTIVIGNCNLKTFSYCQKKFRIVFKKFTGMSFFIPVLYNWRRNKC